jgi:hypothetical protein
MDRRIRERIVMTHFNDKGSACVNTGITRILKIVGFLPNRRARLQEKRSRLVAETDPQCPGSANEIAVGADGF